MQPFFSIIIPVYNVAAYLEKCLDSILGQGFREIEVICINDGSTDDSANILENYASQYAVMKIVSMANSGTAAARNEGIRMALGEYLLFVDSDDWLEDGCLTTIHERLQNDPLDVLSFNGRLYHEAAGSTQTDKGENVAVMRGWVYYNRHVMRPRLFHFVCVVIRAYRRAFILDHGLFFHPGILHEDNLYTPQIFFHALKVAEIADPLYVYRIRPGSKMQEFSLKQVIDKCEVANNLGNLFLTKKDLDISRIARIIASDYIGLYGIRVKKAIGRRQQEVTDMINKKYFRRACFTPRHRFLYLLIWINPTIYRFYMRIVKRIH
ncbi:MAG: glycosyltransferase [Bacteroidales bacterium]|nr:glycosyltransferase [Bacteroidales bacterium]